MVPAEKEPDAPVQPEHGVYDADVPDVENLEPDFDAEHTDEVDEVVIDFDEEVTP